MRLQHFADYAAIFQERFMKPLWERYPQRENDTWDSLGLFLEGYAFERQGRRPDYGPAAADVVMELKRGSVRLDSGTALNEAWQRFRKLLGGAGLNEANNPICPKGTVFSRKGSSRLTSSPSALELATEIAGNGNLTLVTYFKNMLGQDKVENAHRKLRELNGVGPKIASLFLRDLATYYNFTVSKERHLLQPIDVWVRRIVKELGGPANDQDVGKWIVSESATAWVNPEAVNQGMWYFAREIAGSYYRLKDSIHDLKCAEVLFAQHKQALNRAAQAATLIRIQP